MTEDETYETAVKIAAIIREELTRTIGKFPSRQELEAELTESAGMPISLPDYDQKTGTASSMLVQVPFSPKRISIAIHAEAEEVALQIDPEVAATLKERGGTWAVYQNQAVDSSSAGHLQFLKVGADCTYAEPPPHMPDTEFGTGWKYRYVTTLGEK